MPEIRYKTLLLLSSKRPSEISTPQGVEQLSVELRATINQILDGSNTKPVSQAKAIADPNDSTQAVLFTAFIIQ
jgi:flagellar FliL protein